MMADSAPAISFGGNKVTNTTQSVVVGQQIALTGNVPSLPACVSVSSQSWTLSGSYPGDCVGDYVHSLSSGSISAPALNQPSATFYWVNSQASSETATFTVTYSTGQQATAQVTFNVTGPTSVSVQTPTGQVQITSVSGAPYLEFGKVPSTVGIQFNGSATPPSGDSGTFFYEQLINKYNIVYHSGGNCSFSAGTGLDTSDPYNLGSTTSDSPGIQLFSNDSEATADFAATMFLLWQSGTAGSIPIPLGYVNWQWSGDAIQGSGTWSVKSGTGSSDGFSPSNGYPQWTTHFTSAAPPCH